MPGDSKKGVAQSLAVVRHTKHTWRSVTRPKKFADAEPLLLDGHQGLAERVEQIPDKFKVGVDDSLQRLIDLYTAWDKPEKADQWRKKLKQWKDSQKASESR